jgi:hypothetical protein
MVYDSTPLDISDHKEHRKGGRREWREKAKRDKEKSGNHKLLE